MTTNTPQSGSESAAGRFAGYGSVEALRNQVIACAMSFEDANRRGDLHIDIDIEDLSVYQLTELEQADDDYNSTKANLFAAVRALRLATATTAAFTS